MQANNWRKSASETGDEERMNGAAIITENGEEIPITETMIQQALKAMEDNWNPWSRQHMNMRQRQKG
ncbi:PA1571 family protein [Hahella sp. NBU794]|uniref:PA1571 family protein n=1 Tax=Hahella sp. NBU794 TaxID=3422590 RepID=UPI003D6F2282